MSKKNRKKSFENNYFIIVKDMSSRQKLKSTNDIFDMISENDEDIKFDEYGILKPVTVSKSTIANVCLFFFSFCKKHFFFFF